MKRLTNTAQIFLVIMLLAGALAACSDVTPVEQVPISTGSTLLMSGAGSLAPLTSLIVGEYAQRHGDFRLIISSSDTVGGVRRRYTSAPDVGDSPVLADESGKENGISSAAQLKLPIAIDGIVVVVNSKNPFAHSLTVEELKQIWMKDSDVKFWSDVRPEWPRRPIHLYALGPGAGSFEQFGDMLLGSNNGLRADASRPADYAALASVVGGDEDGLAYMGYSQYNIFKKVLRPVAIGDEGVPVLPSVQTLACGNYPFQRILHLYISRTTFAKPHGRDFITFYLDRAEQLARSAGCVPFEAAYYQASRKSLQSFILESEKNAQKVSAIPAVAESR